MRARARTDVLPRASPRDTIGILANVLAPTIAKGAIIRRPRMVAMAERLNLDSRAVRTMQRIHTRYGSGPLLLRIPFRSYAMILASEQVHHVLEGSPEPFATAEDIKRAALSHFEPLNVLISHGASRAARRLFHEHVLDSQHPAHHMAERFVAIVQEEADRLLGVARSRGELVWTDFYDAWYRVVRRIVFGDGARDDYQLTQMLNRLRARGNWAFLVPKQKRLRDRFLSRVAARLDRAEPDSLAGIVASMPKTAEMEPVHQVPQWLFAYDAAGIATLRTLALLATHPDHAERARREIVGDQTGRQHLPYLRACVLDALRLWPTTPMILRQSTRETEWGNGPMPAHTGILIYTPFFHRDDESLPYAHRFAPEIWLEDAGDDRRALVPFSGGPAACPGRELVLLTTAAMLAALLERHRFRLRSRHPLRPDRPLPGTLNNYALRFGLDRWRH